MMNIDRILLKNTIMLYLLNFAKMVFPLLTLPYLTRVLSVEIFGIVAYVKAIMQYMQVFVDFGFMVSGPRDIVLVRNDRNKLSIVVYDILLARIIVSVVALIILLAISGSMILLENHKIFTFLSFIVIFLSCFFMDYLFRGLEIMEFITMRFVVMKAISVILTFVVVKSDADILWIPILDILSSLVAIILVWMQIYRLSIFFKVSNIKVILKKIKESSIYFFNNVSGISLSILTTLVVGEFLGSSDVAYWSVCMQIVAAVHSTYNPLTDALYPHMILNKDMLLIRKSLKIYMPIIFLGCSFVYFLADYILFIIGGKQYINAETVLKCLIPVMFFGFPSMLFGWPCLGAINKGNLVTYTTSFIAVFQVFALALLLYINEINLIVVAMLRSFIEFLLFVSRMFLVYKNKMQFSYWN